MLDSLLLDVLFAESRIAFSMFDKDGDGSISAQEVQETMQSLGMQVEPSHVKLMVKKVDTNGMFRVVKKNWSLWKIVETLMTN